MVEGALEPAHPIAVTFPAGSKAIDALRGTKRGPPPVVPDETKLTITNCASRGSARSKTFGAGGHCSLLLNRSCPLIILITVALHEPVRFSNACSLRRSRSTAQLHVGNRPASKEVTGPIRRFMRSEPDQRCHELLTTVLDETIVAGWLCFFNAVVQRGSSSCCAISFFARNGLAISCGNASKTKSRRLSPGRHGPRRSGQRKLTQRRSNSSRTDQSFLPSLAQHPA